jgi:hypothetical protein
VSLESLVRAYRELTFPSQVIRVNQCSIEINWSSRAEARRFRPMTSSMAALSSIVANGHQMVLTVPPHPLGSFRTEGFPSTAGSQPGRPALSRTRPRLRLTQDLRSFPFLAQSPGVSDRGCAHRPLAQHGLLSPRLQMLLRPYAPVWWTPFRLGLFGLLGPVFALAGCPSHLPFFALAYFPSMLRPLPHWLTEFAWWLISRS